MQVKNVIRTMWFKQFGKNNDKEYFKNHYFKLEVNNYSSFDEFFTDGFKANRMKMLELIFPQIQLNKSISKPLYITTFNDENYKNGKFGVIVNGKIEGFSRITSFYLEEYGIFHSKNGNGYDDITLTNQINDSCFRLHLNKYNSLNGEYTLIGDFEGEYNDYLILDFNGLNFHAKTIIKGLNKNSDYPSWIEYLVDSVLNYENQDYKMSLLNIFSSFENFISNIHDKFIFEYLANKSSKSDVDFNQLKNFAQERKRLFDKANDVIEFLQIPNQDDTIKVIEKYEKIRHRIAHGTMKHNELEKNFDYLEIVCSIIKLIISVSTNKDINSKGWEKIIKSI